MLAMLSITHRITGVALCAGALLLVYWLMALAAGPESYAQAHSILTSALGYIVLIAFSWAMYYHLCNGIRHLFWDIGKNLSIQGAEASGKATLLVSSLLTVFTWILAHAMSGGGV
jgi:succinate dehydrogenase / fumarate reductase cytochrome b subunit